MIAQSSLIAATENGAVFWQRSRSPGCLVGVAAKLLLKVGRNLYGLETLHISNSTSLTPYLKASSNYSGLT
jgi:hypothetical protein